MHYNPFKYIRSEKDIIRENFVYHHAKYENAGAKIVIIFKKPLDIPLGVWL